MTEETPPKKPPPIVIDPGHVDVNYVKPLSWLRKVNGDR